MTESKKMTFAEFAKLPFEEPFADGIMKNEPGALFMSISGKGVNLKWIAKKGAINDWAIYSFFAGASDEYILSYGRKVTDKDNILRCVPCDNEMLKAYNY
jgi:hypothetical protein